MGSFNKYSNFNPQANYKGVRFGSGIPVLEVELNELQQILQYRIDSLISNYYGEGISGKGEYSYNGDVLTINNEKALVNGNMIDISTLSIQATEGDKIYLNTWENTVTFDDKIKLNGNLQSEVFVKNTIMDNRVGEETSRRIQLQFNLSKEANESSLYLGQIKNGRFVLEAELNSGTSNSTKVEIFKAKKGQTVFTLEKGEYRMNVNALMVYVNGVPQFSPINYTETSINSFTLSKALKGTEEVIAVYTSLIRAKENPNCHNITHMKNGDDPLDISDLQDKNNIIPKINELAENINNITTPKTLPTLSVSEGKFKVTESCYIDNYNFEPIELPLGTNTTPSPIELTIYLKIQQGEESRTLPFSNPRNINMENGNMLMIDSSRTKICVLHCTKLSLESFNEDWLVSSKLY